MKKRKRPERKLRRHHPRHLRSAEELTQIAKDLHAGKIWTSGHCRSRQEVGQVFAILGFLDKKTAKNVARRVGKKGMIFEYMDRAMPLGINGMPIFFSFRTLRPCEKAIVDEKLRQIERAMEAIQ